MFMNQQMFQAMGPGGPQEMGFAPDAAAMQNAAAAMAMGDFSAEAAAQAGQQGKEGEQEAPKQDQWYKTKLCTHVNTKRGCWRGADCHYAHSEEELRSPPDLYKTSLCPEFAKGHCPRAEQCSFAHGMQELRATEDYFKTRPCWQWMRHGSCAAGDNCRHAHGFKELKQSNSCSYRLRKRDKDDFEEQKRTREQLEALCRSPATPHDISAAAAHLLRLHSAMTTGLPMGPMGGVTAATTADEEGAGPDRRNGPPRRIQSDRPMGPRGPMGRGMGRGGMGMGGMGYNPMYPAYGNPMLQQYGNAGRGASAPAGNGGNGVLSSEQAELLREFLNSGNIMAAKELLVAASSIAATPGQQWYPGQQTAGLAAGMGATAGFPFGQQTGVVPFFSGQQAFGGQMVGFDMASPVAPADPEDPSVAAGLPVTPGALSGIHCATTTTGVPCRPADQADATGAADSAARGMMGRNAGNAASQMYAQRAGVQMQAMGGPGAAQQAGVWGSFPLALDLNDYTRQQQLTHAGATAALTAQTMAAADPSQAYLYAAQQAKAAGDESALMSMLGGHGVAVSNPAASVWTSGAAVAPAAAAAATAAAPATANA